MGGRGNERFDLAEGLADRTRTPAAMTRRILVLVPAKASPRAKARLSDVLDGEARTTLMEGLLEMCLTALQMASARSAFAVRHVVVTDDARAEAVALRFGASLAPDGGQGPNRAIAAALASASQDEGVCVLAADLPLLDEHGVWALLRAAGLGRCAIAPDRLGTGTNALGMPWPDATFPFAFGPNSFVRHLAAAAERDWTVDVLRCPTLAVDLDEPSDLDLAGSLADVPTDTVRSR